jgi:hypothetical protein
MGPDGIVVASQLFDNDLGLPETVEDFAVEQFVSEFAIEGLVL